MSYNSNFHSPFTEGHHNDSTTAVGHSDLSPSFETSSHLARRSRHTTRRTNSSRTTKNRSSSTNKKKILNDANPFSTLLNDTILTNGEVSNSNISPPRTPDLTRISMSDTTLDDTVATRSVLASTANSDKDGDGDIFGISFLKSMKNALPTVTGVTGTASNSTKSTKETLVENYTSSIMANAPHPACISPTAKNTETSPSPLKRVQDARSKMKAASQALRVNTTLEPMPNSTTDSTSNLYSVPMVSLDESSAVVTAGTSTGGPLSPSPNNNADHNLLYKTPPSNSLSEKSLNHNKYYTPFFKDDESYATNMSMSDSMVLQIEKQLQEERAERERNLSRNLKEWQKAVDTITSLKKELTEVQKLRHLDKSEIKKERDKSQLLQTQVKHQKEQIERKDCEKQGLYDQIHTLEEKSHQNLKDLQSEIQRSKTLQEELSMLKEDTTLRLQTISQHYKTLKADFEEAQNIAEESLKENEALQHKICQLEKAVEDQEENSERRIQEFMTRAETQRSGEIQSLHAKIEEYEQTLQNSQKEKVELLEKINQKNSRENSLVGQVSYLEDTVTSQNEEISTLKKDLQSSSDFQTELARQNDQIQQKCHALEHTIQSDSDGIHKIQMKLSQTQMDYDSLLKRFSTLKQEKESVSLEISQKTRQVMCLQNEIKSLRQSQQNYESDRKTWRINLRDLEESFFVLQERNEVLESENRNWKGGLLEKTEELNHIEETYEQVKTHLQTLDKENQELTQKNTALENALKSSEDELRNLTIQLKNTQDEHFKEKESWKISVGDDTRVLENQVETLTFSLNEVRSHLEEAQTINKDLQKDKLSLRVDLENSEEKSKGLELALEDMDNKVNELYTRLLMEEQAEKANKDQLQKDHLESIQEKNELKKNIDLMKDTCQRLEQERDVLLKTQDSSNIEAAAQKETLRYWNEEIMNEMKRIQHCLLNNTSVYDNTDSLTIRIQSLKEQCVYYMSNKCQDTESNILLQQLTMLLLSTYEQILSTRIQQQHLQHEQSNKQYVAAMANELNLSHNANEQRKKTRQTIVFPDAASSTTTTSINSDRNDDEEEETTSGSSFDMNLSSSLLSHTAIADPEHKSEQQLLLLQQQIISLQEELQQSKTQITIEKNLRIKESEELRKADETVDLESKRADEAEIQLKEVLDLLEESNHQLEEAVRIKVILENRVNEAFIGMKEFELGHRQDYNGHISFSLEDGEQQQEWLRSNRSPLIQESIRLGVLLKHYMTSASSPGTTQVEILADVSQQEDMATLQQQQQNYMYVTDAWRTLGRLSRILGTTEDSNDNTDINNDTYEDGHQQNTNANGNNTTATLALCENSVTSSITADPGFSNHNKLKKQSNKFSRLQSTNQLKNKSFEGMDIFAKTTTTTAAAARKSLPSSEQLPLSSRKKQRQTQKQKESPKKVVDNLFQEEELKLQNFLKEILHTPTSSPNKSKTTAEQQDRVSREHDTSYSLLVNDTTLVASQAANEINDEFRTATISSPLFYSVNSASATSKNHSQNHHTRNLQLNNYYRYSQSPSPHQNHRDLHHQQHNQSIQYLMDKCESIGHERDQIVTEALNLVDSSKEARRAEAKAQEAEYRKISAIEMNELKLKYEERLMGISEFMNKRYIKMKMFYRWRLNVVIASTTNASARDRDDRLVCHICSRGFVC